MTRRAPPTRTSATAKPKVSGAGLGATPSGQGSRCAREGAGPQATPHLLSRRRWTTRRASAAAACAKCADARQDFRDRSLNGESDRPRRSQIQEGPMKEADSGPALGHLSAQLSTPPSSGRTRVNPSRLTRCASGQPCLFGPRESEVLEKTIDFVLTDVTGNPPRPHCWIEDERLTIQPKSPKLPITFEKIQHEPRYIRSVPRLSPTIMMTLDERQCPLDSCPTGYRRDIPIIGGSNLDAVRRAKYIEVDVLPRPHAPARHQRGNY